MIPVTTAIAMILIALALVDLALQCRACSLLELSCSQHYQSAAFHNLNSVPSRLLGQFFIFLGAWDSATMRRGFVAKVKSR